MLAQAFGCAMSVPGATGEIMTNRITLGSRGVLSPGKLRWLRALGWMLALFFLISLAVAAVDAAALKVMMLIGGRGDAPLTEAPLALQFVATTIAAIACLGFYWFSVRNGEKRQVSELELRPLVPELVIGLLIGFLLMILSIGLLWAMGAVTITPQPIRTVWNALRISVQSGVVEEVLLRLVAFRLLWRAFGVWPALAMSALLFGFLHMMNPNATVFASICIALEAGVLLAAFYVLTGRAWLPIGVHAGWNFTQGWIFGAAVSGTSGFAGGPLLTQPVAGVSEIISGGAFGPEASLPGLFVCTAAGIGFFWLAWKRGLLETPAEDPEVEQTEEIFA